MCGPYPDAAPEEKQDWNLTTFEWVLTGASVLVLAAIFIFIIAYKGMR